jgi:hypothetical protein
MISTSIILSTGREEVDADERSGRDEALARSVIGRVEVLVAKIASGPERRFGPCGHLGLDLRILEHRLDDQIAAGERGVVGAWR